VRTFVRESSLSLVFLLLFLGSLVGQAFAGWHQFNNQQVGEQLGRVTFLEYLSSAEFVVDVAENWQSEYLQFFLFIFATIWLVQKGSPESKKPGDEGLGSDKQQLVRRHARPDSPLWAKVSDWRHTIFSNSLLIVMGAIFLLAWTAQALSGLVVYNAEQLEHGESTIALAEYLVSADFWNRTLQNWQSEFLAVGSMIALSIYLRQRGSPESKLVGAPHDETAVTAE
jgi:hypothetical protein